MTNRMTQEIDNVNIKSAANISYVVRDAKTPLTPFLPIGWVVLGSPQR